MTNVHFSSKTPEWETPQYVFDQLNEKYKFNVDVCATFFNRKVPKFWSKEDDGLAQDWTGLTCWMNPPYGREIAQWVRKASMGGGKDGCCASSGTHGYTMVSRIYTAQSRNRFY